MSYPADAAESGPARSHPDDQRCVGESACRRIPRIAILSYDEFRMAMEASRSQLLVQQYNQSDSPKPKSKTSWWRR
jgi:hypothetical protein